MNYIPFTNPSSFWIRSGLIKKYEFSELRCEPRLRRLTRKMFSLKDTYYRKILYYVCCLEKDDDDDDRGGINLRG